MPKEGWLQRQLARAERDAAEWPEWRQKASELADERGNERKNASSSSDEHRGGVVKLF